MILYKSLQIYIYLKLRNKNVPFLDQKNPIFHGSFLGDAKGAEIQS